MPSSLTIILAQVAARVGDIAFNTTIVRETVSAHSNSDLIVFPELHLCGYPPEDLVLKPAFLQACRDALEALAKDTRQGPALLIGTPWIENGKVHNAMALLQGGSITALWFKHHLPNYGVFDEQRVFSAGPLPEPIDINGIKIGVPICEDIWQSGAVTAHLKTKGAELLIVPNGSPFSSDKAQRRKDMVAARVAETGLPLLYLNRVGGQDELVFDGASFALKADGQLAAQASAFVKTALQLNWNGMTLTGDIASLPGERESLYAACCLGLSDYVAANGFQNVLLGLSGGIDSALVAAMCADALGPQHVRAVMLPSPYTSKASLEDAKACAKALGITYDIMPITPAFYATKDALTPVLAGKIKGLTDENLQSRLRGTLLMALSNDTGAMLVTTGNKSEMAVGYATLYGDMNGGFNPVKDLYKTQVYELTRWRNTHIPQGGLCPVFNVIPERILTKAPSAELRDNQTDQDSLPAYDTLDAILIRLIEQEKSVCQIEAEGYDRGIIQQVERLVRISEFKRRQAPPGPKLTSRNFGRDRRYPISNGFSDPCSANASDLTPDIPEYHERTI